ncbi:hypothetical protein O181_039653 [Austropuccinia psidii MF-1]|uniref:Uncharacterized protein n=1 Tax=Austropuccinia psidii MF-1 TaxID=1389203 RepID=A0A9Q3DDT4_9BASI|nr:hypothetical protein [Austropuccinia psidii MF-1]
MLLPSCPCLTLTQPPLHKHPHTRNNAQTPTPAHDTAHSNATAPHPRYCAAGSTSVICKMIIPWRWSPFMDELVSQLPTIDARFALVRGPSMEGEAPSRRGGMKSRGSRSFSGLLGGYPVISEGARERLGETEPSLLKMMEQMTKFMGQLSKAVTPSDNSKAPAFKNPSMKAPKSFDGIQAHKLRAFIQSCKLLFHDDSANFFSDRKKVLSSTFQNGRACKWN